MQRMLPVLAAVRLSAPACAHGGVLVVAFSDDPAPHRSAIALDPVIDIDDATVSTSRHLLATRTLS